VIESLVVALGFVFEVAALQRPSFGYQPEPLRVAELAMMSELAQSLAGPRAVCSMRVWVADPAIDPDMVKASQHSVDPDFTKASPCEATEVRPLGRQPPPPRR
jgi:hypothetical protein